MASKKPSQPKTTSRREALRQAQLAEAARQRRIRRIVIIVASVVVVAIIAVTALAATGVIGGGRDTQQTSTVRGDQVVPPHATDDQTGIMSPLNSSDSAPLMISIEDYQCPICKTYEDVYGPVFESLASKGELRIEYRTRYFLDEGLRNDSSVRAARAAAAADMVGKYQEYHDAIFANQPAQEGTGYTEQQLRVDFPAEAGITGDDLTTFQNLYDQNQTADFVDAVDSRASEDGYSSTPTFIVNGQRITFSDANPSEDYVMSVINAAA